MEKNQVIKDIGNTIGSNKSGVIYILGKNNISLPSNPSNYQIALATIDSLSSNNIEFAKDLYALMYGKSGRYSSYDDDDGGSDAGTYVKGAVTIASMFTDMWGKTNKNNNDAAITAANIASQTQIKTTLSSWEIAGIVAGSAIVLGLMTILVIRLSKTSATTTTLTTTAAPIK